jgi:hypothetical protein
VYHILQRLLSLFERRHRQSAPTVYCQATTTLYSHCQRCQVHSLAFVSTHVLQVFRVSDVTRDASLQDEFECSTRCLALAKDTVYRVAESRLEACSFKGKGTQDARMQ